jgi:hypothetical protein
MRWEGDDQAGMETKNEEWRNLPVTPEGLSEKHDV